MSYTRLVACGVIVLASSVSGCMSQAKLLNYTADVQPNGKPAGCVIAIPERTNSWPYYNLDEAKARAEKELGGPVDEVKPDPNSKLAARTSSNNVTVTYRLKQATDMSRMTGQQQPGRQPAGSPVIQAGGMGGMPQPVGQASVIPAFPPTGGMPANGQGFGQQPGGYPPGDFNNQPLPQQPPFPGATGR